MNETGAGRKKERHRLLGVQVDALTIDSMNRVIAAAVKKREKTIIANHNLHSVYLFHHDAKMRSFYESAAYVHIDGMPLVFWGRLLGMDLAAKNRVTYVDWIVPLLKMAAANGWRVFYLGGAAAVTAEAAQRVAADFPGLPQRFHHGFFDLHGAENKEVLAAINAFRPQLLLVGMGMPRQEHWILDNYEEIAADVVLTAGACFDCLAGVLPTPPRWLGKLGLEWIYRLAHEPRRLWKRYLWEPWFILPLAARDLARRRERE
jgi:N-acetylglucosaminyldiphosphoundecaprenol N-acetyl-beta-D-mannosaminyltransferase